MERPLTIDKNKKVIGMVKDELGGKIMAKIVVLTPKMYSYVTHDDHADKKAKVKKKCVIKREMKIQDYKECLENNKKY